MKICTDCKNGFKGRGYRCEKCRPKKPVVDMNPHKIKLEVRGPYAMGKSAPEAWFYRGDNALDIHIQVNEADGLKHYSFKVRI